MKPIFDRSLKAVKEFFLTVYEKTCGGVRNLTDGVCRFFGRLGNRSTAKTDARRVSFRRAPARHLKTSGANPPSRLRLLFRRREVLFACMAASFLLLFVPVVVLAGKDAANPKPAQAFASGQAGKTSEEALLNPTGTLTATGDPTQTPEPAEPTITSDPIETLRLKYGETSPYVSKLQQRLMELDYMDEDETTEYYGPQTFQSIKRFQFKNGLTADGVVGKDTWTLLFSSEAKKFVMSLGIEGDDVTEIQTRLRDLDYLKNVTGKYDEATVTAVKAFQEKNGLTADGTVGFETNEALFSENAKANFVGVGTEGDEILTYQKRLKTLAYLTTEPDGKYGKNTQLAVKTFQEHNGLIADGFIGYETKKLLMSSDAQAYAVILGMSGEYVTTIQNRLVELNYMKKATGYYGEATQDAVELFQKTNGLSVDGKVGRNTLNALLSSTAKKAPAVTATKKPATSTKKPATSTKKPSTSSSASASTPATVTGANVDSFISVAKSKLGSKYVGGGKGPKTFDCSGFVYWCLNQVGVKQSYMTATTWRNSTKYPKITNINDVKAGDILCFTPHHVGIAIGGGMMIDASSGNGKVVIRSYMTNYWKGCFKNASRVF